MSETPTVAKFIPERSCHNCVFLSGAYSRGPGKGHCYQDLGERNRTTLLNGSFEGMASTTIACAKGIWPHNNANPTHRAALLIELREDRKDRCFYFAYSPGMKIEAADELERRARADRDSEVDRGIAKSANKTAWWSVFIAAFSLIVSIASAVYSFRLEKLKHGSPPADSAAPAVVAPKEEVKMKAK